MILKWSDLLLKACITPHTHCPVTTGLVWPCDITALTLFLPTNHHHLERLRQHGSLLKLYPSPCDITSWFSTPQAHRVMSPPRASGSPMQGLFTLCKVNSLIFTVLQELWDHVKSGVALIKWCTSPEKHFTTQHKTQQRSGDVCVAFYDQQWAALNRAMKPEGAFGGL